METQGGLPDEVLANLAEDIETGEQVEALGRALGFNVAAINRYTETNIKGDRVTCRGTRNMLFDWRQKVGPCYQHLRLKEALTEAGLVMLADTYLNETTTIQDIYSERISDSLTVRRCREKLANKYLSKLCKIQMKPWDPDDYAEFEDMHTVVTMVKKDAQGRDTKNKVILQGSVDEIFSTKNNGKLPFRILISAPAGRGKTTAVAKMAYDWAQKIKGSALEHLPLLFVLKLRSTGQLTSIGQAIKSQLLSDVADLTPEVMEHFIRENQGICHIILDGLDEYAGITSSKKSLGSNIVDVMLWKEFPECRVLVTTRPHLENFFNQEDFSRVYSKMWIEGFSRDNSREYIDKFFAPTSNLSKGHALKDYLNTQPLINELVITPLFCLMVCHLWSEGLLGSHTKTQTDLLDSVNVFLMHHANARSKSNCKITHDELGKIICKLGKVALAGLLDDAKKIVFTPRDFRRDPVILERACELGIISKTTTHLSGLPQSHDTSSTTIEFYHKLAQEHSAGKYLAAKTKKYMLRLKLSKLDRVLHKIRNDIGNYENLIRFAAGTENSLCIRIMEAILANSLLEESERYRILLDCSSETSGAEGSVSSLVQRCVTAQRILLKSPTVYTVVGMQNLPEQLKKQVRQLRLEGCVMSYDLTNGLWSCLESSFSMLQTVTISDSSLSFDRCPLELLSVIELHARRVTSQSYEGLLSSLPSLKEIDITIDDDVEGNTSQITASRSVSQSGDQHLPVHIKLQALPSLSRTQESESKETVAELGLLIREQRGNRQLLQVSGMKGQDEEALVNLFVKSTHLKSLNFNTSGWGSQNYDRQAVKECSFDMKYCQLSAVMTETLLSCLSFIVSLHQFSVSGSSLRFPLSPLELPSVTNLIANGVTTQSYECLVSSMPSLTEMEVTIDDAEGNISAITASRLVSQTGDPYLPVQIKLQALPSHSRDEMIESGKMTAELGLLVRDQRENCQWLQVSVMKGQDEEALVNLFVMSTHLKSLNVNTSGCGSQNYDRQAVKECSFNMKYCQLSAVMTETLWSRLSYIFSLHHFSVSDSSLSFPPSPPELPSVTNLIANGVTSQSYECLVSSMPNLKEMEVTVSDAEENMSEITPSRPVSQTGDHHLPVHIKLQPLPSHSRDLKSESREGVAELDLLIREQRGNSQWLQVSGWKDQGEESLVNLFVMSTHLKSLNLKSGSACSLLDHDRQAVEESRLEMKSCQLSAVMTDTLWACLSSIASLLSLIISDSSLKFPPSPPELTSILQLKALRLTSQSYEGLFSSIPNVKEIDITAGNAKNEDISQIQTSLRRHLTGQELTLIRLDGPHSLPSEERRSSMSREKMRLFGLHISDVPSYGYNRYKDARLSGLICGSVEETVINLVQRLTRVTSSSLYSEQFWESLNCNRNTLNIRSLTLRDCKLTAMITSSMWSCLRSFPSLHSLTISDSSLSFSPSPPELTSVTMLKAERVTSQSYEGLLSSLPGLNEIDITIDDAEKDISQITTGLRRTGGQQITHIYLQASEFIPLEKMALPRETTRGLGLLIREETKNLWWLGLGRVKTDEEDLVYLIECCRYVKAMKYVGLYRCGNKEGGRLESHLNGLHSLEGRIAVQVWHGDGRLWKGYDISHIR